MKEIGLMGEDKGLAPSFIRMEVDMMGIGTII